MLLSDKQFQQYVSSTYPDITERILDRDHIGGLCSKCDRTMGLQFTSIHAKTTLDKCKNEHVDLAMPFSIILACPVCRSRAIWVVYRIETPRKELGPAIGNAL